MNGVCFGDVGPHLRTKTTPWLPPEVTIDALSQFDAIYLRKKRDSLRSYFHEPQKNEIHL